MNPRVKVTCKRCHMPFVTRLHASMSITLTPWHDSLCRSCTRIQSAEVHEWQAKKLRAQAAELREPQRRNVAKFQGGGCPECEAGRPHGANVFKENPK